MRLRARASAPIARLVLAATLALPAALALPAEAEGRARCDETDAPIADGFGARGPYAVRRVEVENPAWQRNPASVFLPVASSAQGARRRPPVVFFGHGFGATSPVHYHSLAEHLASRGIAVVYTPYPTAALGHERRYATLWAGFQAAAASPGLDLDLSRVGFVGHSYGGGATPSMAWRGIVERGWGRRGAFLMVMAPWYVLDVGDEELASFPSGTRLLVQVYEDERINDPRIAIDLYHAFAVPETHKAFVTVRSDAHGGCELRAGHTTPATDGIRGTLDPLDRYAVFRLLDALVVDAFEGDPGARRVALGTGTPEHVSMGTWSDGSPRTPLLSTRTPLPMRPATAYRFPQGERERWVRAGGAGGAGD